MRIDVRGRSVGCDDTGGAATALVLVHGFPLDRRIWAAQARELAGTARVIAFDLGGFGESESASDTATMDDYAAEVRDLLDALGIEKAVLGGVSMGGYVAMAFLRKFPERLRGLVLVDTRAGPDSAEARTGRDKMAGQARTEGAAAVARQMIGKMLTPDVQERDPEMRDALVRLMSEQSVDGIVRALGAIRDRPDSSASVARIKVPTLVVTGAEDTLIPPKEAEALHAAIAGSTLVRVPGAAHLPNYERPAAFNGALREFLSQSAI